MYLLQYAALILEIVYAGAGSRESSRFAKACMFF